MTTLLHKNGGQLAACGCQGPRCGATLKPRKPTGLQGGLEPRLAREFLNTSHVLSGPTRH